MEISNHIPAPAKINPGLTEAMAKLKVGESVVGYYPHNAHNRAKKIGIKVATKRTDVPYQSRIWRIA